MIYFNSSSFKPLNRVYRKHNFDHFSFFNIIMKSLLCTQTLTDLRNTSLLIWVVLAGYDYVILFPVILHFLLISLSYYHILILLPQSTSALFLVSLNSGLIALETQSLSGSCTFQYNRTDLCIRND